MLGRLPTLPMPQTTAISVQMHNKYEMRTGHAKTAWQQIVHCQASLSLDLANLHCLAFDFTSDMSGM